MKRIPLFVLFLAAVLAYMLWPQVNAIQNKNAAAPHGQDLEDILNLPAIPLRELPLAGIKRSTAQRSDETITADISKPAKPYRLSIVHGKTRKPIPFAKVDEVDLYAGKRYMPLRMHQTWHSDISTADPSLLNHFQANAKGIVLLDRTESKSSRFIAAQAGLWGSLYDYQVKGGQGTLELWPDQFWTVRTIDDLLQPLKGIPVGVLNWRSGRTSPAFSNFGLSDAQGLATLPHIQLLNRKRQKRDRFWISPRLPLAEDLMVEINPKDPPGMPISLQLPPLGGLELRIIPSKQRPISSDLDIRMRVDPSPHSNRSQEELHELFREEGVLEFPSVGQNWAVHYPAVGLGLSFVYVVYSADFETSFYSEGIGPTSAGETKIIELRQPMPTGLSMRLIDPAGAPLQGADLSMNFQIKQRDHSRSSGGSSETDMQGFFFLSIDPAELKMLEGASSAKFQLRLSLEGGQRQLFFESNFPPNMAVGVYDLGDIQMHEREKLVQGLITEEDGTPIRNATFFLETIAQGGLEADSVSYANSTSKGEVILFGETPSQNLQYQIVKTGFLPLKGQGTPPLGTTFILNRGYEVSGNLVIPNYLDRIRMNLSFRYRDSHLPYWADLSRLSKEDLSFFRQGLEKKPIKLKITARPGRVVLGQIDNITPWINQQEADARLRDWILSPTPQLFQLQVVDTLEQAVPNLKVQLLDQSFEHQQTPFHVSWNGELTLPTSSARTKLSAKYFHDQEVQLQVGANKIVMQKGIAVRFIFESPPNLPANARLAYRVKSNKSTLALTKGVVNQLTSILLRLGAPGEYVVEMELTQEGVSAWETDNPKVQVQDFSIEDRAEEQDFRIRFAEDSWQKAVEAFTQE